MTGAGTQRASREHHEKSASLVTLQSTPRISCSAQLCLPSVVLDVGVVMDRRMSSNRTRWGVRARRFAPVGCFLAALASLAAVAITQGLDEEKSKEFRLRGMPVHVRLYEPRRAAAAVPAAAAQLPDDRPVIGVEVAGRYRAYEVRALTRDLKHVVNDLVAGVPLTVAYCPLTDCTTVYADPNGTAPLSVAVGGWVGEDRGHPDSEGVMLLRLGASRYLQDTGEGV